MDSPEETLTEAAETPALPAVTDRPIAGTGMLDIWMDKDARAIAYNSAEILSKSDFVPKAYRGNPGNCMVAFEMAEMLQVRPVIVMQNLNMIHGQPNFKTTFLTVLANRNGKFAHPIRYIVEGEGESLKVTAWSTMADDGQRVEASASMAMAKMEGWSKPDQYGKSKYLSMPEHMLHFRAATFLVRRYNPEALFGFSFSDELEDVQNARRPAPRATPSSLASLNNHIEGANEAEPVDAEVIPANAAEPSDRQPAPVPDENHGGGADAPAKPF